MSSAAFRDVRIALWAGKVKTELIYRLKLHRIIAKNVPFFVRPDLDTKRFLDIGNVCPDDLAGEDAFLAQEILGAVADIPELIRQEVGGEYGEHIAGIFERDFHAVRRQLGIPA